MCRNIRVIKLKVHPSQIPKYVCPDHSRNTNDALETHLYASNKTDMLDSLHFAQKYKKWCAI